MQTAQRRRRLAIPVMISIVVAGGLAANAWADHVPASGASSAGHGPRLVMPMMNPERGKRLFVSKGCVACHAINGIGGHDAPAMDAHTMDNLMNPFDFAAKMWNHAPAMIAAQEEALGGQIYFTGDELADIIAFMHDDEAQHHFSENDLTATARKMMHHEHHGRSGTESHAGEIGHHHSAGHAEEPMKPKHQD